jgi:hypothetical protein
MTRQVKFRVSLTKEFSGNTLKLALGITNLKLRTFLSEDLAVPVYKPSERSLRPVDTAIEVTAPQVSVFPGADKSLPALFTVERGAFLRAVAKVGGFYKIGMEDGRFGFVDGTKVRRVSGVVRFMEFPRHPAYARVQPAVYVTNLKDLLASPIDGNAEVRAKAVFYGTNKARRKVFAFVGDEKVFFQMVPEDGKSGVQEIRFRFPVKLKKDSGLIRVFALEGKSNLNIRTLGVIQKKQVQSKGR